MRTSLEKLGRAAGWMVAPAFAAAAAVRHARPLHPAGEIFEGFIDASTPPDDFEALATALHGRALLRFSGAIWKGTESLLPDVLGCAMRLRDEERGDQDLLFATIRRPWTLTVAPLTTRVDDYLANHYFGVSPFEVDGVARRFYLRLRPRRAGGRGKGRHEKLVHALDEGPIEIAIDAAYRPRGDWRDVAMLRIKRFVTYDEPDSDAHLHFDPFRTGRGIEPRGVIHALRRGAYVASQATRRIFE